jgi:hypothetical protein
MITVLLRHIAIDAANFVRDVQTSNGVYSRSYRIYDTNQQLMKTVESSSTMEWAAFGEYTIAVAPLERVLLRFYANYTENKTCDNLPSTDGVASAVHWIAIWEADRDMLRKALKDLTFTIDCEDTTAPIVKWPSFSNHPMTIQHLTGRLLPSSKGVTVEFFALVDEGGMSPSLFITSEELDANMYLSPCVLGLEEIWIPCDDKDNLRELPTPAVTLNIPPPSLFIQLVIILNRSVHLLLSLMSILVENCVVLLDFQIRTPRMLPQVAFPTVTTTVPTISTFYTHPLSKLNLAPVNMSSRKTSYQSCFRPRIVLELRSGKKCLDFNPLISQAPLR